MTSVFVECKRTDKIDFVKPLRKYIMQEFGKDQAAQYEKALENLTTTREDLRLNTERTDSVRSKYIEYISLLKFTEKHFRIGEKGVRINFYWYDCNSKKRASQYGLDYETACCRFNVGAIESQIAFLHNRSSDEGIKQACKYFQMAAGTFASLAETTRSQGHLVATPDLDGDFLTLLSFLMLAQAQECFFEKAERAGMKSSILFKLAAQVADYYEKASQPIDSPSLKSSINQYWPVFIQIRAAMYKGIANYHKGQAVYAEDKYGEQVAWLSIANSLVSDPVLIKKLKSQPISLQQQFMGRCETITNAFRSAHNDNSKIYHELVPRELSPLEMKAMVSAIAFKPPVLDPKDDPFRGLVSRMAQETTTVYKTKVNQKVQGISATVEENDRLAKGTLSSMNLPGSLQALEKPQGIPDSIRSRVDQLKKIGGAERLQAAMKTSCNYAMEASSLLADCRKVLKQEEELDSEMRSQYGNQWVLPASHLANSSLIQEISKYENNLIHAKKSDAIVDSKFKKIYPTLQKLCGSESEMVSLLPVGSAPSAQTQHAVSDIKGALGKLEDIIAERETLLKETLSVAECDDISADVMAADHDSLSVMEQALEKYSDFDNEIQKNVKAQQQLLEELYELNQTFIQSNSSSGSNREGAVRGINEALDVCQELFKNLGEGSNFYQQFCGLLNTLKAKCDKYVADRKGAKIALESRLAQPQFSQQQIPSKYYQHQTSNYPQPGSGSSPYNSGEQAMYQQMGASPQYSNSGGAQSQQYRPPQNQQAPPQYSNQGAQPQQFIQVQGPDGKPQYIPASSMPYYQRPQ